MCETLGVSSAVVLFFLRTGDCACSRSQTVGGFPPLPRSYSRRLTPGLDGRGGGGKQTRPRRAETHIQCQRALLCSRAARATQVHVRHWVCVHACVWSQQSCGSRLLWSYSFCGRGLRVLTLSDPGRLSARAALFPKGELEHAPRPHFAVQPRATGKVDPEYSLLPPYRANTLTTRLSPLESLESHTQSGSDSRCHLSQTAPGCIPHLPAYSSRGQNPNGCE